MCIITNFPTLSTGCSAAMLMKRRRRKRSLPGLHDCMWSEVRGRLEAGEYVLMSADETLLSAYIEDNPGGRTGGGVSGGGGFRWEDR